MQGENKINRVSASTRTSQPTNGHLINAGAYDSNTPRHCKIDGKTHRYHFCSPVFTDHSRNFTTAARVLEYLGEGNISKIDNEPYTGADKGEIMHFWIMKPAASQFDQHS